METSEAVKQLEAGCVKVSPGSTHRQQRPTSPLVTVQPQAARLSPPPGRLFSVASPQLPGAGALLSTRLQPCLLTGPQHPLQVLVRRPLPALQPLSAERGLTPAAHLPAVTPSSSSSADDFVASTHTKHPEKPKRPLRVKTRSGRVSRPPKHKAKDYKFIKTEDLADGHPSDSDDYSELSLEEEEEPGDKQGLFEASCSLRPKAFKCQACDKRYIGKGGLARHFKLNPSHGHLEPEIVPPGRAGDRAVQDHKEARTGAPAPPEVFIPALGGEEGAPSARSGLQLLQQRSRGDLVELALPRLAQAVTVYEFLLVKVEKGYPAKPLFPAVYKEFEELHAMVKNLCRDYLSSASPHSLEPLRINNSKVAESLGITGELLRRNERHPDGVPPTGTCHEGAGWELEQPGPQKRGCQNMEPDLAALKRARSGPLSRDGTQPCVHSASRQKPLSGARTATGVLTAPPGATKRACDFFLLEN